MPRNSSGVYTLPVAAYIAGTTIKSADMNSNLSDIATALTQSLATNGVTPMTGPILAASGALAAPSYAFSGATGTGFYLAGANQIGIVTNGAIVGTFNANGTVTWQNGVIFSSTIAVTGNATFTNNVTINGTGTQTIGGSGAVIILGATAFIISTASVNTTLYIDTKANTDPVAPAANYLRSYNKKDGFNTGQRPYAIDENSLIFPLMDTLGQCRLTKSGVNLLLSGYQGNRVLINGVPQIVPDAGIQLAASNSAATFVYIYAFMSGATMTLEMSTTAPTAQSGTGMKQKTGDATRTLVGAAFTDTGGAWADTDGKLWVLSYFNRKPKVSKTTITASLNSSSTAYVEVDTGMRNNFISWIDEYIEVNSRALINNNTNQVFIQNNIDGTTSLGSGFSSGESTGNVSGTAAQYGSIIGITEAASHYATLFGRSATALAFIVNIGASAGEGATISLKVQG